MFVRSALAIAISLSLSTISFAQSTTATANINAGLEQQKTPDATSSSAQSSNNKTVEQAPLPPTAVFDQPIPGDKTIAPDTLTPEDKKELNKAEAVISNVPKDNESKPVEILPTPHIAANDPSLKDWSLNNLNQAQWSNDIGVGAFPVYARIQSMLDTQHASPGAIDGTSGKNMLKAIASYQVIKGLKVTGMMNAETWSALVQGQTIDPYQSYTITQEDVDYPYVKSIPHDYALQAKMKGLNYTRPTEMFGEKFHIDEAFLKRLNPHANFSKVGETIIVPNIQDAIEEPVTLIIPHKGVKQVYAFNKDGKMIAAFPATIGSSDTPSPTGTYKVKAVTANPWYGYNPKNFVQGKNLKPLLLPAGPNNPVGMMWIALSKPTFGIHGTPNPSTISKTASHGCVRLTNWDAVTLAKQVKSGVTVKFMD